MPTTPLRRLALAVLGAAAFGVSAARANAPGLAGIEARDIREALSFHNRFSSDAIPLLDPDRISELIEGGVVKIREVPGGPDQPQRVVGYVLFDVPRVDVWVAATDPHAGYSGGMLRETRLVEDDAAGSVWYQHLKLPWPVQDRHWLIRIRRDADLAAATEGRVWKHAWALDENCEKFVSQFIQAGHIANVPLETARKSIYTPVNHGAWIAIEMPGNRTLLVYHVSTVVGGSIPDSFVVEWAMLTLDRLLRQVGDYARTIPKHYAGAHEIAHEPGGAPIPPYPTPE